MARGRWQEIVAYVHRLQETEGGKLAEEIVPKAAVHFSVHPNTVWNALRENQPIKFDIWFSGRFNNYL